MLLFTRCVNISFFTDGILQFLQFCPRHTKLPGVFPLPVFQEQAFALFYKPLVSLHRRSQRFHIQIALRQIEIRLFNKGRQIFLSLCLRASICVHNFLIYRFFRQFSYKSLTVLCLLYTEASLPQSGTGSPFYNNIFYNLHRTLYLKNILWITHTEMSINSLPRNIQHIANVNLVLRQYTYLFLKPNASVNNLKLPCPTEQTAHFLL